MAYPFHARCVKWWGSMERFNSTCIETPDSKKGQAKKYVAKDRKPKTKSNQ
jgi:hypothetical protein